jgi:hypothetical protein
LCPTAEGDKFWRLINGKIGKNRRALFRIQKAIKEYFKAYLFFESILCLFYCKWFQICSDSGFNGVVELSIAAKMVTYFSSYSVYHKKKRRKIRWK